MKTGNEIVAEQKVERAPRQASPPWTRRQEQRLARMWRGDVKIEVICRRLRRTTSGVVHRVRILALKRPSRRWAGAEEARLVELWRQEVEIADICKRMNRSLSAIKRRVRVLDLAPPSDAAVVVEKKDVMPADAVFEDDPRAVVRPWRPRTKVSMPWRRA